MAPGMGNSPTRIAIAYKSGGRGGISPLGYGGLNPILPFLEGRSGAARRVVIFLAAVPSPYQPLTIPPPSPYHRPTCAAAPSDFMPKSEGAAALVLRMYGDGTAQYGRMGGERRGR